MKLVFVENNRPVTDSLTVAEVFGKTHDHVMRDIRQQIEKLIEAGERDWGVANFGETQYQHHQNKQWYPKYSMTEDAFAIVAMSYVTPEAMKMKIKFLTEFKEMRDRLNKPQFALPQTFAEALRALAGAEEEKDLLLEEKTKLLTTIEADRPLVIFAESLKVSNDSILVNELAKILKQNGIDIGGTRLFKVLREDGYLMSKGEQYNMPTQRSMDLKIMEVKTGTRGGSDGAVHITRTPKITAKGQIYFINKYKQLAQAQ